MAFSSLVRIAAKRANSQAIPRAGRCDRQYVCIPVRGGTELSGANIGQKGDIPWPKATRYKFIFLTAANRLTRHSVNAG